MTEETRENLSKSNNVLSNIIWKLVAFNYLKKRNEAIGANAQNFFKMLP